MKAFVLIAKPLAQIVTFWRPGSGNWSWAVEYMNLIDAAATLRIVKRVDVEGIDFADDFAPVMLGSDGRVWDGHHRICIAIQRGIPSLMTDIYTTTPPKGTK